MAAKNSERTARKPGGRPFSKGQSGNASGRPPGSKNTKTLEWEALGEAIKGKSADQFAKTLEFFMLSKTPAFRLKGAELYLKALEYFQPKQARVEHTGKDGEQLTVQHKWGGA